MTGLYQQNLNLPGAPLGEPNPLPYFRSPLTDLPVQCLEPFPQSKQLYFGWETGFRVLPYRMQDNYSRQLEPLTFRSIVLENELLRATFLPELGGRLISLVYKPEDRELLSVNPAFQPANLAIRNAWFSGGIEWNVGQYGHAVTTCSPVFAARITGEQGEPGLRLYEFERTKSLFWQLDFYLPPGSSFLIVHTRLVNPNPVVAPAYYWTNIAVPEGPDVRILAPAPKAIYVDFSQAARTYGYADLPNLPGLAGADATYPLNSTFANEFFFQPDESEMPWETALDGQGCGLIEASTARLKYRKLFLWGSHQGGRHWQEFLAPGNPPYCEIQAGLAPTQLHGLPMPAGSDWQWTQVFGYLQADPALVHSADWHLACQTVEEALQARLSPHQLAELDAIYRARADIPAWEILSQGAGWGCLELKRRAKDPTALAVPTSFVFPETGLSREQTRWLNLLDQGVLSGQDPALIPGDWLVQAEWFDLLKQSLAGEQNQNWYSWLHLGVMCLERFDEEGALSAWQHSVEDYPNVWAYRNLAILSERQRNPAEALDYYAKAWQLAGETPQLALTQEYLAALAQANRLEEALAIYETLSPALQQADRVLLVRGRIALALDDLATVEKVLAHDFAVIREGENELTDLWLELCLKRVSRQTGQPVSDALRQQVAQDYPPPEGIDFRIFSNGDRDM
jgi:tetratricopeptide (TPR) repeat protein